MAQFATEAALSRDAANAPQKAELLEEPPTYATSVCPLLNHMPSHSNVLSEPDAVTGRHPYSVILVAEIYPPDVPAGVASAIAIYPVPTKS